MFALLKIGGIVGWVLVGSIVSIVVFAFLILKDVFADIFFSGAKRRQMDRLVAEAKEEVRLRERNHNG